MTRAEHLARVQRLLALATSDNPHEARTAAALAARAIAANGFAVIDPQQPSATAAQRRDLAPDLRRAAARAAFFEEEALAEALRHAAARARAPYVSPPGPYAHRAPIRTTTLGANDVRRCQACWRRVSTGERWSARTDAPLFGKCEACA
jgi:hypothetical protein